MYYQDNCCGISRVLSERSKGENPQGHLWRASFRKLLAWSPKNMGVGPHSDWDHMAQDPKKSHTTEDLEGALAIGGLKTSVCRWENCVAGRSWDFLKVMQHTRKITFILGKGEAFYNRKTMFIHTPPRSVSPRVVTLEKSCPGPPAARTCRRQALRGFLRVPWFTMFHRRVTYKLMAAIKWI